MQFLIKDKWPRYYPWNSDLWRELNFCDNLKKNMKFLEINIFLAQFCDNAEG